MEILKSILSDIAILRYSGIQVSKLFIALMRGWYFHFEFSEDFIPLVIIVSYELCTTVNTIYIAYSDIIRDK